MHFAWGYAPTLVIATAIRHRVFDLLDESPKTVGELAEQSGASERGLAAILNSLVALELLAKDGDRYSLTPESATFLVSTKPGFHGNLFHHMTDQILPKWMQLDHAVRTGKPTIAVNAEHDRAHFFAGFVESLFPLSYHAAQTLGDHLGVSNATQPIRVLDIAAGSGVWGIALAEKSPHVRISAVDWPEVLEVTKKVAARHRVADRLNAIPGDIREADFGKGHHVATLGHILHSEGRERSRELLRKVFDALAPGGTIAIAEFVPNDDRTGPPQPLLFAVNMLVNTDQGDTFTFAEMNEWLRETGFVNPRQLDAGAASPLTLGTKP